MSKILMPKPSERYLSACNIDVFNGATVISLFYNKGMYGDDFIPRVLDENAWVPKREKQYKVWWHSTDPSDPSDQGQDILDYIEEFTTNKDELIENITERLRILSVNRLHKILESL